MQFAHITFSTLIRFTQRGLRSYIYTEREFKPRSKDNPPPPRPEVWLCHCVLSWRAYMGTSDVHLTSITTYMMCSLFCFEVLQACEEASLRCVETQRRLQVGSHPKLSPSPTETLYVVRGSSVRHKVCLLSGWEAVDLFRFLLVFRAQKWGDTTEYKQAGAGRI